MFLYRFIGAGALSGCLQEFRRVQRDIIPVDREMQMRLGRRFNIGRLTDLAQRVAGLDRVAYLDGHVLREIGIMRGVAAVVPQDDGRAEALVVIDGVDTAVRRRLDPVSYTHLINACLCILDNPEATLADLMEHIQGPDFPTRALILGRAGIRAAYATGRGRVTMRARTDFEEFGQNRTRIIVHEIPYQVNKRMLIKSMADQVNDKRLDGISDIRDESDRTGMRIVIELKREANPQVVLNRLFAQTQLQTTFAVNMLALVKNQSQPKVLTLREILDEYLSYQEEIIIRRTCYDLRKAQERAHLLEGLLIAQDNIDEVIRIIRTSYDNAKENLMQRFGLDDVQAQAILDMRLKALQGLDREKLQNEYKELEERIAYFQRVLGDMDLVKGILKDELTEIRDKYGDDRRTEIQDVEDEIDIEDLIEEEDCCYTLSNAGYIKRMPALRAV